LKEKLNKALKKWEAMCEEAYKKQKLERLGFNITPERDMVLYKEIYNKAKKKNNRLEN